MHVATNRAKSSSTLIHILHQFSRTFSSAPSRMCEKAPEKCDLRISDRDGIGTTACQASSAQLLNFIFPSVYRLLRAVAHLGRFSIVHRKHLLSTLAYSTKRVSFCSQFKANSVAIWTFHALNKAWVLLKLILIPHFICMPADSKRLRIPVM